MANVIHSTLTYNANLGPAQAQIKALTGQIATLTAAFNTLDKAALKTQAALSSTFLANAGGVGGFTTQVVKASSSIDNFGQALSKQRLTMRQYFREAIAGYTKQNSLMKQLAMQQVRMQQSMAVPIGGGQAALMTPTAVSMTNMANKTALAAQKFSIFNELVQGGSTRLLNFGKNTQWTGRQLMVGFTLPLILFTAVISKQFREIDKELTRFEKVYGSDLVDTVDGSSKRMREAVKELAFEISGAYGIAAKDTAALAADIAATGKEGQALLDSVKQTTRLSVLGEVERQEAMQATLSIQNAFKLNTLELAESIDFLNAVENQTSTTLQDLAGAIPRVGPVIQSLGGDIKDLSVLLVAMREGGVSAAEAANALKSGLGRMINPTRQAKEVASSFGVSLDSIVQNSRGELLPMIFGLQDALSGLDEFARAQVIEKIFGKYQFARMSALFANLRRQGSQTLTVMELASASSTQLASIANQELRALQESTAMRFQRTIENLKNSLIPLGQTLTETLIPILSGIGSGIKGFMEFFQSLPQPIKDFTKFAVAITALAGPVVMLVGLFGNLVANGIKFGMMLVRLSAKMVGMRFEKFELLTKDVMEARLSVDMLTDGFEAQEVALRRLTGVIQGYASALRTSIPAAGSIVAPMPMGARPGAMPLPVYRRQKGSTEPEFVPGSGRGDKIPAMLEPGEFVVNRKATEKFGPILVEMNRGNVQGFQNGMDEKYVKAHLAPSLQVPAGTLLAQPGLSPGTRDILSKIPATQLVTTFNNLVVALKHATNSALNTGNAMASTVAAELKTSQAWSLIMNQTGLDMKQLQPVIDSVTGRLANLGNELIDDPQLYAIVEQSLRELAMAADPAAKVLQTLSRQYGAYAVPGNRQQRQDLGVGIAPSYRGSGDPRVGPKVQSMPFVDLRAGGVPVSPASAMPTGARFGGLESISNAQKIATAEKSILNYTKMQESFAQKRGIALRDMAEVTAQIKQLEDKHRKGQVTFAEFERRRQQLLVERNRLAEDIKKSEMMEKKYQDRITSTTGRIASIEERRAAIAASTNRRLDAVAAMAAKGARSDINARPGATGPSAALLAAKDSGSRGGGLMNAAFMGSMAISSVAMLGGASSEAAMKIGAFSTALMMATMMLQSVSAKGMFTNFLGMGALGGKISGAAGNRAAQAAVSGAGPTVASSLATRQVGVVAKHAPGGLAPLGGGLATLGRGVSVLGGPVGMAAAAAITAGIAGYMAYRNAAEEARERAVAAFADPAKTAEYFGISVEDVTEKLKGVSAALPGIEEIDQALRDSVKQDYAGLIEKIRFSGAQGGARELAVVFNKMLASGLSAEQAEEAVKAIAMESGAAGGAAYAEGMRQGFFAEKDAAQVAQSMADLYNPEGQQKNIAAAQQALTTLENRVGEMGRIGGSLAQNLDNTFGDFMTGYASYGANIANSVLSGFTGIDLRDVSGPFDMFFDKDKAQANIDLLANTERQIHQMQTNIEEMADVTGDSVVKITEVMFQNFQKAPEETIKAFRDIAAAGKRSTAVAFDTQPIKDFIAEIDPISGSILNAMIGEDEDMAMMVQEAIISGMSVSEIIEAITRAVESGGDIKAELQAEVDLQIKETNINNEITRLRDELKEDLVMDLDLQIEDEEKQLEKVNKQLERMDDFRARHEGVLKKEMNRLNRQSEDAIEGMENEIETIRDRAETRKEDFDERMDQLNKEKEEIEDSAESYIDSLKKRERADNFYSNQRKTAFSALQKLAAGDVFGFLQEREQMSADAQTFSYENTIESIEEKRDREIETIDEVMEKEKERQEDYEKKVEDRIELIEDQIDAEKDLMDERQKNFDREMRFFDRKEKRRRTDLENEKKEVQVSLDQLRATREMAEAGTLVDQKELSKALGEEKAKPYFEEQKAIVKTEMMKKYLEMKDKYPDETSAQLQMRAHGELIDLFNALYGVTPGQGRRPTMGWAQQLEDIGFTTEFNTGGEVKGPGTATSDSIPARLSNGEYVIRASSVKKYGTDLMDSINTANFANGGPVYYDSHWANRQPVTPGYGSGIPTRPMVPQWPATSGGANPPMVPGPWMYDSHRWNRQPYTPTNPATYDSHPSKGQAATPFWTGGKKRRAIGIIMSGIGEQSAARRSALGYAMDKYGVDLNDPQSWKRLTRRQKWEIYKATQTGAHRYAAPGKSSSSVSPTTKVPVAQQWSGIWPGGKQQYATDPNRDPYNDGRVGISNPSSQSKSPDWRKPGDAVEWFFNWVTGGGQRFAKGGLVQGFYTGGPVTKPNLSTRSGTPRSGWQGNRGPNGWPYNPVVAGGTIPGTSKKIYMQKDVLPLFLSFASDYNRLIRKIGPNTGAYDPRNAPEGETKSNHPSGTALDINTNEEGSHYTYTLNGDPERQKANFDWWKGKTSPLAPWKPIATMPYMRMQQLLSKYKILQWFGPSALGGPSWLSWDSTDPMHIQLDQDKDPTLSDVQKVMKDLGIKSDGTGAPETGNEPGGGNKDPRDPRPPRPRSGANGGGLTGVPSEGGQGNTQFGKVAAKYLARAIFPNIKGKNKPDKDNTDNDKPDKDGNKPDGSYKDQYIKNGLLVKLLHETGFKGGDLRTAFGVVMGESGGNRRAVNNNGNNKDWGLFQMNDYWNRNIVVDGKKADFSPEKIFDAQYNSRFALATTKDPGVISYWKDPWKDWNAYNHNTRWYQNGLKLFDANPQWRRALGLANGGAVFGPGSGSSDSIPAMLSNGEYVINADSVRKYGRGFLDKVNSGQLGNSSVMPSGFANGGFVTPSYNVPVSNNVSSSQLMNSINNMSVQGSNATSNNSNIKIVVNGSNTSAKAVANQVVRMINNATSRRDHSRSIS